MEEIQIHYLLKIGEEQHMKSLLKEGELFLRPIKSFRESKWNKERRDEREGTEEVQQITWIEFDYRGKKIRFDQNNLNDAQLWIDNPELNGNIYSMYAVSNISLKKSNFIDDKNKDFGDHFVLIKNPREFISRIIKILGKESFRYDIVEYYDKRTFNGRTGIFRKTSDLSHQNEFRIFIPEKIDQERIIKIGSIEDIAEFHPISFLSQIRFIERKKN